MAGTYWVYTCTGTRGESVNIVGNEYPTCSPGSAGQWQEITIPDEVSTMDIVAMLLVVGMALCVALGYIAGQQR